MVDQNIDIKMSPEMIANGDQKEKKVHTPIKLRDKSYLVILDVMETFFKERMAQIENVRTKLENDSYDVDESSDDYERINKKLINLGSVYNFLMSGYKNFHTRAEEVRSNVLLLGDEYDEISKSGLVASDAEIEKSYNEAADLYDKVQGSVNVGFQKPPVEEQKYILDDIKSFDIEDEVNQVLSQDHDLSVDDVREKVLASYQNPEYKEIPRDDLDKLLDGGITPEHSIVESAPIATPTDSLNVDSLLEPIAEEELSEEPTRLTQEEIDGLLYGDSSDEKLAASSTRPVDPFDEVTDVDLEKYDLGVEDDNVTITAIDGTVDLKLLLAELEKEAEMKKEEQNRKAEELKNSQERRAQAQETCEKLKEEKERLRKNAEIAKGHLARWSEETAAAQQQVEMLKLIEKRKLENMKLAQSINEMDQQVEQNNAETNEIHSMSNDVLAQAKEYKGKIAEAKKGIDSQRRTYHGLSEAVRGFQERGVVSPSFRLQPPRFNSESIEFSKEASASGRRR